MGNPKISGDTGGEHSGRQQQHGQPRHTGRGGSVQGPHQDAKGGPQGASQGGAPRGGSRVEPSHVQDAQRNDKR